MASFHVPNVASRRFYPRGDPYDLPEDEFILRYRLPCGTVDRIASLLPEESVKGKPLPRHLEVCACLRYLATGSFQQVVADTLVISKSSAQRSIWRVCDAVVENLHQFVSFDNSANYLQDQKAKFYSKAAFPNVIGAIDCTHVNIIRPKENGQSFMNRKGHFSINVQAICNYERKFVNIYAAWPGSCHDSFILQQSAIYHEFENGQHIGVILGDGGYPCRNWILTPYRNANSTKKVNYNNSHAVTRARIEQSFGILKRRFYALHNELRVSPQKAVKLICTAAAFHNLAVDCQLNGQLNEQTLLDQALDDYVISDADDDGPELQVNYRDYICDTYFSD
jgi:hypothetical protein